MDDRREQVLQTAARYLGAGKKSMGAASAAQWDRLMAEAYAEMLAAAVPRHRLRWASVEITEVGKPNAGLPALRLGDMPPIASRDLCRLFTGCRDGYALLATLGMELDLRIRRLSVSNPALAAAVGACGSAYIEAYIDETLQTEVPEALTPRFSPGYGDAPLSAQPALLQFLDAHKLGVHLTNGLLMLPEKSVSALMGISPPDAAPCESRCSVCTQKSCPFREET